MKKAFTLCAAVLYLSACQPARQEVQEITTEPESEPITEKRSFPENLTKVLDAHGGYDTWAGMHQLSYIKGTGESAEKQLIELKTRKVLLTSANHTIGFDGNEVWINPADAAFGGSPRFYHNLYFYFFAMPFVLSDPGINYSDVEPLSVDGTDYPGIKISYNEGVGDSPKDNYILYYDAGTFQMQFLQYTVTYRSQEINDDYRLIKYSDWANVSGLLLPTKLNWYTYEDGKLGEMKNEAVFSDISIGKEPPADELFAIPEGAKIDAKSGAGK
ncbi:hypothetical protein FNH22_28975 [Fulvivirga sp. M361]|uniref:DUF6503 family protein n=1 Tax=Fulvivirga sp. M361 TaxID=2594266 RepID=UPI001179F661|nr:DUF6503 family protein [Fulvivirga sp. M361]TRX48471.1 hypothetical protein FNH22_28975 [Fulvivirga sp. M361]